jgi:hypothetical protein
MVSMGVFLYLDDIILFCVEFNFCAHCMRKKGDALMRLRRRFAFDDALVVGKSCYLYLEDIILFCVEFIF